MEEARASWNTVYLDPTGFECQITLRDDDETVLAERVAALTERILDAGGEPVLRRSRNGSRAEGANRVSNNGGGRAPEKTYVDQRGVRRCNLTLTNGRRCNQPVTEREGRYGLFWSCPSYRDHAPAPAR